MSRDMPRQSPNILVFQHASVEDPGVLLDFWQEEGWSHTTIHLDQGDTIPPIEDFDLLVVMGGPQDVWEVEANPWLLPEIAAIRRFVLLLQRPFLGFCLGHQLLARALGGQVARAQKSEVGVSTVRRLADEGVDLLEGADSTLEVLQWHSDEITKLPAESTVLATSDACRVQAFRYRDFAFGFQFHLEITSDTVRQWAEIPTYLSSLETEYGAGAILQLDRAVRERIDDFNHCARVLHDNVRDLLARRVNRDPRKDH